MRSTLFALLVACLVVSCTTYRERMWRDDPEKGTGYETIALQWFGGTSTIETASGSKLYIDNQQSAKDWATAATTVAGGLIWAKVEIAKQISARLLEGEITKRMAAQLQFDLAKIETAAQLEMFVRELPFRAAPPS